VKRDEEADGTKASQVVDADFTTTCSMLAGPNPELFKVCLNKGRNVLTVYILANGNMNLAYFDFKQVH
jgi:hypothetical protein